MWLAHQTYLQSNVGLAYKLKLKKYHLALIRRNKKLYEDYKFKNYSPLYYATVYDTYKFPIQSVKPN